ncbi:TonB-dependent receptor plug domain-containing protein [Gallaecimonas xiamenensis]|uniref:Outer membrane receptor protein n=1 Tax=Gallaecimonas xiamenensis 3-C-1 TaxID=745411 RepID=K2ID02_9GAMM|nr:TonB-dependent receptor [Gallaecimonas xiamenensis]EKE67851.1 outer membrane receptor protein [Gallaecimonas xiamenensis 3-C-1]
MIEKKNIAKFVQMTLLMSAGAAMSNMAYAADDEASVQDDKKVERIEVTGSRIKRTDIEGASPVVVIDASEISRRGFTSTFQVLDSLTQATGSKQGEQFTNSFTPAAQDVNLRGLGGGRTLVLLNGRRVADYPLPFNGQSNFFNWSTIPLAAVKRVEILTDGASAIYGSDAIAGVVNVITKDQVDETTISAQFGTTTNGGGDSKQFQATTGFELGSSNWVVSAEYKENKPIYGKDRDWLNSYMDNPNPSSRYPSLAIIDMDWNGGANFGKGELPSPDACINSESGYVAAYSPSRADYCGGDLTGDESLRAYRENLSLYAHGEMDLTDNISLFTDILYFDTSVENSGAKLFWGGYSFDDTRGLRRYQRIFSSSELGANIDTSDETTTNVTLGLKGVLAGQYDWEVSYTDSRYDLKSRTRRFKEEAIDLYFLTDRDYGIGSAIGSGVRNSIFSPLSQETLAGLTGTQKQDADSSMKQLTGIIGGDLFELPAGMVQFSATAEYSSQDYSIDLDERTLNKDGFGWSGLTGTEGGGDRDRYAAGIEFLVPVFEGFDLSPAIRYDKYDDGSSVGGRFTSQIKFTYRPIDELMFRGGWSQTFRAPDMHYLFAKDSGFYTNVVDTYQCDQDGEGSAACENTVQIQGNRSGNLDLKEEKGQNFSLGLVAEPIENLSFTIDYYKIELEDVVYDISAQRLVNDEAECRDGSRDPNSSYCQFVFSKVIRGGSGGSAGDIVEVGTYPINQAKQNQSGFDASASYKWTTDYGDLSVQLGYTIVTKLEEQVFPDDPMTSIRSSGYDPRSKVNGSVTWSTDKYQATLYADRTGSTLNYDEDGRLSGWTRFNLTAGMELTDNVGLGITVNNLFDERPPEDKNWTAWPYFDRSYYNAVGREVFVSTTVRF